MRKLIAGVFLYSLDGLLADEGTQYWQFCFGLPVDPADLKQKLGVYQSAYAHIMGRTAYEAMAGALPTADHPFTGIMNAARKVVFSRTLRTAEWANTTIAAGDTTEEIDMLSRGGDGHTVVWGGVSVWRSLRLDLTDEFRRDLHPYVAGEGTRLFDDAPCPTGSTWSPARRSATGSSGCSTAGTASPTGSAGLAAHPARGDVLARVAPAAHQIAEFEVDLVRRLAESGCPVAALEPRVEPRDYERDGFVVSLWTTTSP
jgi:dihydrofolate reductase